MSLPCRPGAAEENDHRKMGKRGYDGCDMQILGTNQSENFAWHDYNLSQIIPNADLCQ